VNELIECYVCDRPGRLRLDMHPQQVEHSRGRGLPPQFCELPPRDITHPVRRRNPYPSPYAGRAACSCDTRAVS
jgi:hypothetical protein